MKDREGKTLEVGDAVGVYTVQGTNTYVIAKIDSITTKTGRPLCKLLWEKGSVSVYYYTSKEVAKLELEDLI